MCNVPEVRGRIRKEREGKGDTRRLGRHKEKQETARRPQGDAGRRRETQGDAGRRRETQGDAGRRRETQGDAGNRVARLSEE